VSDRRDETERKAPHHPPIPDVEEPVDAPNEDPVEEDPDDEPVPPLPGVI